jgi:integrase
MVREFHKAVVRAGLPKINFHRLRHTCASLLVSQGVHIKVIQELLGHSDFYLYEHLLACFS